MKETQPKEWEEEFAEIVWKYRTALQDGNRPQRIEARVDMDNFISNLLLEQKQRWVEEVEMLPTFKAMKNLVKLNGKVEETEIDIIEKGVVLKLLE